MSPKFLDNFSLLGSFESYLKPLKPNFNAITTSSNQSKKKYV